MKTVSQETGAPRLAARSPRGGRPTQEMAERLSAHILDISLEQFLSHGIDGASMDSIATEANVSKRTLYSRYGSKVGLIMATIQWGIARHMRPIATKRLEGTVRQRLMLVGRKMLDLSLKPEILGIEELARHVTSTHIAERGTSLAVSSQTGIDLIRAILEEARGKNGRISAPIDIQFAAAMLLDALVIIPRTRILWKQLDNTPQAKTDYLERTLDLLTCGIPLLAA